METFSILTYHDYLYETFASFRQAVQELNIISKDITGLDRFHLENAVRMRYRYSFVMSANSIEAAANSLLKSLKFSDRLYSELEKGPTLHKFELYCECRSHKLDRSTVSYRNIKELISARNEFVHPKPDRIDYVIEPENGDIIYDKKYTQSNRYPKYFFDFEDMHIVTAISDILSFVSQVCIDICGMEVKDSALLLGMNSFGHNNDIYFIEQQYGVRFDKRSIGIA